MTGKRAAIGAAMLGAIAWGMTRRGATGGARPHESESEAAYRAAAHRVLILGGGFAGLETAVRLDRRLRSEHRTSVLVVDRDTNLVFTPLLWSVADGRADPSGALVPIRAFQKGRRFHVLHAEVETIDLDRREVTTSAGTRPYDSLVIALGSITAIPDLPGLREHARTFTGPGDAVALRDHLIAAVEAAHQSEDPAQRRAWLTFVVGGGGDTGVELGATIHEYIVGGLLKQYPWLTEEPPRIVVVGRAQRLVPMSTERTSAAVRRALEGEGIEVLTGTAIESVTNDEVRTSDRTIPARTLFWAAGITAPKPVVDLPVEHARNGAVVVDDRLRLPTRPEVYVLGDSAWAFDAETREPVPPTAQAAQHQGAYVADAIAAALDGRETPPFRFRTKGRLALLGHRTGVAEIGPVVLTGRVAWVLWHLYYLAEIPALRNRLNLLADWTISAMTGRQTGQLGPVDPRRGRS